MFVSVLQLQSRRFKGMFVQACEFAILSVSFYKDLISRNRTSPFLHLLCPFLIKSFRGPRLARACIQLQFCLF